MAAGPYAVFADFSRCLRVLGQCPRVSCELLSHEFIRLNGATGPVAMAVANDHISEIEGAANGEGLTVEIQKKRPPGHSFQAAQILHTALKYVDVTRRRRDPTVRQRCTDQQCLVAVRGHQQGEAILQHLYDLRTRGIDVRLLDGSARLAIPQESNDASDDTEFLMWVVHASFIDPVILDAAWRVWWGPTVSIDGTEVFTQYSWELPNATSIGRLMQANSNASHSQTPRLLLLSPEDPVTLEILVPSDRVKWEPLVTVGHIAVKQTAVGSIPSTPSTRPDFRLDLRLVSPGASHTRTEQRLVRLRAERAHLDLVIEELEDELHRQDAAGVTSLRPIYQPLYIYVSRQREVPFPIQRLLIEQCDQEGRSRLGLSQLVYQQLNADDLPPGIVPEGSEVHVVTTVSAIGQGTDNFSALSLQEYAPSEGLSFRLLPSWCDPRLSTRLRLFVPDAQELELYPHLTPGPVASGRLADALLPGEDPDEWAVLLMPSSGTELTACRLRLDTFEPITEVCHWNCVVGTEAQVAAGLKRLTPEVRQDLIDTFADSFGNAAVEIAEPFLSQRRRDLESMIHQIRDGIGNAIDVLRTELITFEEQHNELYSTERDKVIQTTNDQLEDLQQTQRDLDRQLDVLERNAAAKAMLMHRTAEEYSQASDWVSGVEETRDELRKTRDALQQQLQDIARQHSSALLEHDLARQSNTLKDLDDVISRLNRICVRLKSRARQD